MSMYFNVRTGVSMGSNKNRAFFFHGGSLGIKRITHVQVISSVHSAAALTGAVVNCPYGDLSRVTKPVKSARRFFTP